MLNIRRPTLLLSFTILNGILLVALLIYYSLPGGALNEAQTNNIISRPSSVKRVFIGNSDKYIDPKIKESIESSLYVYLNKDKPDLYTGTIRPGSNTKHFTQSQQTVTSFLVDIDPVKLTYKVTLISDQSGTPSLNIECAQWDQQLDKSNECRDTLFAI